VESASGKVEPRSKGLQVREKEKGKRSREDSREVIRKAWEGMEERDEPEILLARIVREWT